VVVGQAWTAGNLNRIHEWQLVCPNAMSLDDTQTAFGAQTTYKTYVQSGKVSGTVGPGCVFYTNVLDYSLKANSITPWAICSSNTVCAM
jgi:hypothetical protein